MKIKLSKIIQALENKKTVLIKKQHYPAASILRDAIDELLRYEEEIADIKNRKKSDNNEWIIYQVDL